MKDYNYKTQPVEVQAIFFDGKIKSVSDVIDFVHTMTQEGDIELISVKMLTICNEKADLEILYDDHEITRVGVCEYLVYVSHKGAFESYTRSVFEGRFVKNTKS